MMTYIGCEERVREKDISGGVREIPSAYQSVYSLHEPSLREGTEKGNTNGVNDIRVVRK